MSLLRKLCLVVGVTAAGECRCVYAGCDAEEAVKALRSAPDDLVDVMAFKRPRHWKRRKPGSHGAEAVIEAAETSESGLEKPETVTEPVTTQIPVETPEPLEAADFEPVIVADDAPAVDEAAELVGGATEAPSADPKPAPKAKAKAAPKAKAKQ